MFGDRIVKAEGADVLCDFLELGCRFGKRQTASATALNEMYQEWCRALAVVPLDRGAVTRVLKEVGLEGEKRGARYELWKGIALQDVEPPAPPVDTSPEAKQHQRSLVREYVRRELRVAPWGSANTEMVFACYRAWCRQRSIQPANRNELSKVLKQMPGISPQKMPDGNTRWNNLDAKWPEAAGWKR